TGVLRTSRSRDAVALRWRRQWQVDWCPAPGCVAGGGWRERLGKGDSVRWSGRSHREDAEISADSSGEESTGCRHAPRLRNEWPADSNGPRLSAALDRIRLGRRFLGQVDRAYRRS